MQRFLYERIRPPDSVLASGAALDEWSMPKEMLQLRASVMSLRFWDDYDSLLPSSPTPESVQTQLNVA